MFTLLEKCKHQQFAWNQICRLCKNIENFHSNNTQNGLLAAHQTQLLRRMQAN